MPALEAGFLFCVRPQQFRHAGILAPASAGLFLHLRRYVSESVEARFPFLGECRHAFFPVAAADQRRQRLKTRAPGAA